MEKKDKENLKEEFTVINDEGEEVKCTILFSFESEETHKNYMVIQIILSMRKAI